MVWHYGKNEWQQSTFETSVEETGNTGDRIVVATENTTFDYNQILTNSHMTATGITKNDVSYNYSLHTDDQNPFDVVEEKQITKLQMILHIYYLIFFLVQ